MAQQENKLTSFKPHRHQDNPKEKELHDKFIENFIGDEFVDLIVFPAEDGGSSLFKPTSKLSTREKRIMLSTIQWLGSPVGRNFLISCGYTL